jgi:hypothetical protein
MGDLQATESLISHLGATIELVNKGEGNANLAYNEKENKISWKGTKAQFYELVYALIDAGAITGNVKQAMEWLGFCLEVKPSNYYGYHQSMRIRKKTRTPFLDSLKAQFIQHMDENDENPRFK